ncbi:MAG: flagellar protein FlaG [Proteobacteria bacterium]|nr:flagellar protein FlaG [Pseudomonadota bacterium]
MYVEPVSLSGKSLDSLSQPNVAVRDQTPVEENSKSEEEKKPVNAANANDAFASLQNKMKVLQNIDLSFSVHEASGKIIVTVVNENTGEVIREIPSSELLSLATKLEETIGLMLDKKV